jgi:GDP-L-fucose synthase
MIQMKLNFDYDKVRIMITGAHGMVGSALRNLLPDKSNIICPPEGALDLRDEDKVNDYVKFFKPEYVIHLAARVGGVKANADHLADFYIDNIRMNTNVLHSAHENGVKKVISMLSTCVFPDDATYPLTEEQIHNGPPHSSNYTYAYTKRMLDIQSKGYWDQYGKKFISVIPNNLYGAHDNFDLEDSHVIPAMMRKIYEAGLQNEYAEMWGDGSPLREFTYTKDLAEILLFLLENYEDRDPINVGNPDERSIKYVAEHLADIFDFKYEIKWDTTKPSGQFRKPSSNEKFMKLLESVGQRFAYTDLETGLGETCEWFLKTYPNLRGM